MPDGAAVASMFDPSSFATSLFEGGGAADTKPLDPAAMLSLHRLLLRRSAADLARHLVRRDVQLLDRKGGYPGLPDIRLGHIKTQEALQCVSQKFKTRFRKNAVESRTDFFGTVFRMGLKCASSRVLARFGASWRVSARLHVSNFPHSFLGFQNCFSPTLL